MAYEEPTFPRHGSEPVGAGPGAYRRGAQSARLPEAPSESTGSPSRIADVDAADAQPGRDRLGVHLGWEFVLLLGVAALGILLYRVDPGALRRPALDNLLLSGTAIGLLVLGAGMSLRAGVPNLAVGPIAVAAALHIAENGDRGVLVALAPAIAIAAGGALVVAAIVVGFHVPGWAATLAAALGVVVFNQLRTGPVNVQGSYHPHDRALLFFGGFAALAVLGGLLGAIPPIRAAVGRLRPVDDPALRGGATGSLAAIGALVLSSVAAVAAGLLMATGSAGPVVPRTGLEWTGIAVGAALLGGTSAYGRRGGVFGTVLTAAGMALFLDYQERRGLHVALFAVAAATIAAGLLVTRLVEAFGRPRWPDEEPELGGSWAPDLPGTWSPAGSRDTADRWTDVRWGATRG